MDRKHILAQISRGNWQPWKQQLAAMTPEAAYESIKLICDACPLGINLDGIVDSETDLIGLTLLGAMQFHIGKRHRGGAQASKVSDSQFENYFERQLQARDALEAALEIDRRHGLAATFNMAVAIDPWEEDQKAVAEARLLDAEAVPLSGYMNLLQAHLEKWGGSHEVMFRIARSRMLPEAPMQYALIARAHWERHLFYEAFDESPNAQELADNYFKGKKVLDELTTASDAILSAKTYDPAEQRLADSWLAFTLFAADQNKRAVRHLDRLKGHTDPGIWGILLFPTPLVKGLIRLRAMFG